MLLFSHQLRSDHFIALNGFPVVVKALMPIKPSDGQSLLKHIKYKDYHAPTATQNLKVPFELAIHLHKSNSLA